MEESSSFLWTESCRLIFRLFIVFPLRVGFIFSALLLASPVFGVTATFDYFLQKRKGRSLSTQFASNLSKILLWSLGFDMDIEIAKQASMSTASDRASANARLVVVSNHVSYLDTLVILALFPTGFVAKRELRSWPIIGGWLCALDCQFIQRRNISQRVRLLRQLGNGGKLRKSVCIFPEGTTTASRVPRRDIWKAGFAYVAKNSGSPIMHVGLAYEDQMKVAWVGDSSFLPHLLALLWRGGNKIAVTYLQVDQNNWENLSARQISSESLSIVEELCVISGTRAGKEDCIRWNTLAQKEKFYHGTVRDCLQQSRCPS